MARWKLCSIVTFHMFLMSSYPGGTWWPFPELYHVTRLHIEVLQYVTLDSLMGEGRGSSSFHSIFFD